MLEQMRKHMNWIMWIILILVIVSFLFFGIYPSSDGRSGCYSQWRGGHSRRIEPGVSKHGRDLPSDLQDQFNDSTAKGLRQQRCVTWSRPDCWSRKRSGSAFG